MCASILSIADVYWWVLQLFSLNHILKTLFNQHIQISSLPESVSACIQKIGRFFIIAHTHTTLHVEVGRKEWNWKRGTIPLYSPFHPPLLLSEVTETSQQQSQSRGTQKEGPSQAEGRLQLAGRVKVAPLLTPSPAPRLNQASLFTWLTSPVAKFYPRCPSQGRQGIEVFCPDIKLQDYKELDWPWFI